MAVAAVIGFEGRFGGDGGTVEVGGGGIAWELSDEAKGAGVDVEVRVEGSGTGADKGNG